MGVGVGVTVVDGYEEDKDEAEEDEMPRISASAVELDEAMRLAAIMRARCVRGLQGGLEMYQSRYRIT